MMDPRSATVIPAAAASRGPGFRDSHGGDCPGGDCPTGTVATVPGPARPGHQRSLRRHAGTRIM
jgi:hypothetical protein